MAKNIAQEMGRNVRNALIKLSKEQQEQFGPSCCCVGWHEVERDGDDDHGFVELWARGGGEVSVAHSATDFHLRYRAPGRWAMLKRIAAGLDYDIEMVGSATGESQGDLTTHTRTPFFDADRDDPVIDALRRSDDRVRYVIDGRVVAQQPVAKAAKMEERLAL